MHYDPFLGKTIAGKFRIIDFIGQGGMGLVYLAEHDVLPRKFAIKILRNEYLDNVLFVERFRREAIAASRVVHPNVVYITDFGQLPEGNFYIVMEYLEGQGLDSILDSIGRLPVSRVLPILIQVADALEHAHRMGVIHRDLKTENVLLVEERGRRDVVKILDFGIAKLMMPAFADARITRHGQVFGTPEYMSPEQASDRPLDGRSDIYSLGILAYELLTGQPPFLYDDPMDILRAHLKEEPKPPSALIPEQEIPKVLDGVVLKCLAKDPDDRYQTAGEVRNALLKVRSLILSMEKARRTGGAKPPMPAAMELELRSTKGEPVEGALHDRSPSEIRSEIHDITKELVLKLVNMGVLSEDYKKVVDRIIYLEGDKELLEGHIALKEQEFETIRQEHERKMRPLREAVRDLEQELHAFQKTHASPDSKESEYMEDLSFQIQTLRKRIAEVEEERRRAIAALNEEIRLYQRDLDAKESEIANLYAQLTRVLEHVRGTDSRAAHMEIQSLFSHLDRLKGVLDQIRKKAGGY